MACYLFSRNSKAYPTNNRNLASSGIVGQGAIVEGDAKDDWLHATSVKSGNFNGVIDGMYIPMKTEKGISVCAATTPPSDPAEIGSDDSTETNYVDDAFTLTYTEFMTSKEYDTNLKEGLKVSNLRGIMGLPHQFLPNTDPRLGGDQQDIDDFGRLYANKIIEPIPLLFMTPGIPSFMSSFSKKQKEALLSRIFAKITGNGSFDDLIENSGGRYYSLKYSYIEYFSYVNAMLRSAAYFLGIQDETLGGKKKLGEFNWYYDNGDDEDNDIYDNNGLLNFIGPYKGAIPFYIEAENSVSDDFGNSTAQSQISGSIDGLSDTARELNFLIGNAMGNMGAGSLYDDIMSVGANGIESTTKSINGLLGRGNVLSSIMSKVQTILSGGRMEFPEIWSDSSFSRSYRCSLKLISPSGDKLSVFYNILVPIYHLLAFVLPRNSSANSFYSPFLVRAYYKGIFNVDMGIITDMSITKGDNGEWTIDGLPTVATVSFEIKDLYDVLSMSTQSFDKDKSILSNIAELDYIANSCGVNINDHDVGRMVRMAYNLGLANKLEDKITMNIFGSIGQYFNQKAQNIFGAFKN